MTPARASISSRVAAISGASNILDDPGQLAAYAIDGRAPSVAVRPGSREEITEIVKWAAAERLGVVPCGARSKLGVAAPPTTYDLSLDVTRLDHVMGYDPNDLTLSVEPGIPLQRLAGILAGHRQFLPLAVPFWGQATIGGTIATGVPSLLRQAYGTARDFLLGVEFITGDGAVVKSGGVVVKNVAGYDLHKLMIGSLGTLGIVTKINFRTFPAPGAMRVFAAGSENAGGVLDLRRRVAQSPLRPLTLDILSPGAVELLASKVALGIEPRPAPVEQLPTARWALLATFSGAGKVLERYQRELAYLAGEAGCDDTRIFGDDESPASFGRLQEFMAIALGSSPASTILQLSVLRSKMNEILDVAETAARANELRWAALAGGLGVIQLALLPSSRDDESRRRVVDAAEKVTARCASLAGNVTIPWCPGEWKKALSIWGAERADFEQMRQLKGIFDPAGIFSPGRFAGGI